MLKHSEKSRSGKSSWYGTRPFVWRVVSVLGDQTHFFVTEAAASFRRNGLMTAAAVTTIMVALLVVGTAVLIGVNLTKVAAVLEGEVQVVAFLRDGLSSSETAKIRQAVSVLPGVVSVRFVGRDEALRRLEQQLGETLAFADLVRTNPLPDSLELKIAQPRVAPAVAAATARQSGIAEVTYGGEAVDRLVALTRAVRLGAGLLTVFLGAVALIVVVNTIRLTIIARRQEIEIMQLVGATRWFVRWPFVIEGVMEGGTAALGAGLVLTLFYAIAALRLQASMPFLPVAGLSDVARPLLISVLSAGVGVGALGSFIAMRRFLVS